MAAGVESKFVGSLAGRATGVGLVVAAIWWVAEAAAHTWLFETGSFGHELVHGDANEIWMRSFTGALLVLMGVAAQIAINYERRTERRVRLLSRTVEQSGEGVLITDRQGVIEYVNPAFTRITGFHPADVIGQRPSVLKSGAQTTAFYDDLWQTINAGRAWEGRLVDTRKDGSLYPALLSVAPVLDERGSIVNFVGVQRDLTTQVQLEERLVHSQKLEALGTLAGGLAHDFGNVLTVVVGQTQLALRHATGQPKLEESLLAIQTSARSATALVKRLMLFVRRGDPSLAVEAPRLDLADLLPGLVTSLRGGLPASINLRLNPVAPGHIVALEPYALQELLLNLVRNAVDALAERGGGCVTVALVAGPGDVLAPATREFAGIPCVGLRVCDDGAGVKKELRARIFEPFFTTKSRGSGTGLGLAMVRDVARGAGGLVRLEETTTGASFLVVFPRAPDAGAG